MILNISNNTDIIRFYTPWLINKFETGMFSIETNKQNNIYELTPNNFELLVFQTKDATNIIPHLDLFDTKGFKYIFLITITPYSEDVEPHLDKKQAFESLKKLSLKCGKSRVVWKYAPIILNNQYNIDYHIRKFSSICKKMNGLVDTCICEFIEPYNPPIHASLYAPPVNKENKTALLNAFVKIAKEYNIKIYSKNLKNNISVFLKRSIKKNCGINITEKPSVLDMGLPNTCKGECEYCFCGGNQYYKNTKCIDVSPVLIGKIDKTKKHTRRRCPALE